MARVLGPGFLGLLVTLALTSHDAGANTLSGTLTYDQVPATLDNGLDYDNITQRPIRNANVLLLDAQGTELQRTVSGNDGSYAFTFADTITEVRVRVLAEMTIPPVRVEDNTNNDALYTMQSDLIDTSEDETTLGLNAASGWDGTAYTGMRVAAPFACLDAIYTAAKAFIDVRPQFSAIPLLKVKWSVNNRPESGSLALGQIGTSHYNSSVTSLFILGKADVDTDEYDSHIMVHEWGHFFEDRASRSDSIGGSHGLGDIIDPRVAFGEGWGNALSAMIFHPDADYRDTSGPGQATTGLVIFMEDNLSQDGNPGWFSEASVQTILYDLFDPTNESFDQVALGLGPIYDVMTNEQRKTEALTTIFSFVAALKARFPGQAAAIDTLVALHDINPIQDAFGTGETNTGGTATNLPVYHTMTVGGPALDLTFLASVDNVNRLGANRYLRFVASGGSTVTITSTSSEDVDLMLYDTGKVIASARTFSGDETITFTFKRTRTYILVVQGFVTDDTGTYTVTVNIQ
jgi:hypothetical protein